VAQSTRKLGPIAQVPFSLLIGGVSETVGDPPNGLHEQPEPAEAWKGYAPGGRATIAVCTAVEDAS